MIKYCVWVGDSRARELNRGKALKVRRASVAPLLLILADLLRRPDFDVPGVSSFGLAGDIRCPPGCELTRLLRLDRFGREQYIV